MEQAERLRDAAAAAAEEDVGSAACTVNSQDCQDCVRRRVGGRESEKVRLAQTKRNIGKSLR